MTEPLAPTWEPRIVLEMLVASDDAAQPRGIMDCVDNDGKPYQSAHMAKLVEHARALVEAAPILGDGWIALTADRALYVDQGKETILCDRLPSPITLVIKNPARADGAFLPAADTCELQLPLADREGVSAPTTIGERQAIAEGAREYLLLASYCGGDNAGCTDQRPCLDCLAMCNVFRCEDTTPAFIRELGEGATTNAPVADREGLLAASPDDYWQPIVDEVERAGRRVCHAMLLNHEAAHLLAWAKIARDAARQTLPIHGEMREAAQAVLDEAGSIAMTMRRRRIFDNLRNALQGDGL